MDVSSIFGFSRHMRINMFIQNFTHSKCSLCSLDCVGCDALVTRKRLSEVVSITSISIMLAAYILSVEKMCHSMDILFGVTRERKLLR